MTVLPSTGDDLFNLELIRSYVDKTQNPRFVERHWLKQEVEKKLTDPNCRFLLLTAEPGAGKSAFIAWLADCNPAWGRYFIRRDQRTPLGDVGAHSLLLQIGFQLAALYPDLFDQEQIEITVRQRIGQANDSEIVGAEIERIVASPFRRKVVDIQQDVRENRRTAVTGVQIGEIYQDVRLVPVEDLQYMALFDPAMALARTNPNQQIVVLIDALDELSYGDLNGTLVQWLTKCPELPPNIRFVLTARPNTSELELFCETKCGQIQSFPIKDNDPRVRSDLLNYMSQWVEKTPKVQAALQAKGLAVKLFSEQAADKAEGNLGYLEILARAIDQANDERIAEFLDLSRLPQELEGLYGFFLNKIRNAVKDIRIRTQNVEYKAWSEVYLPVLGVLAVAREPLTQQQIQQFGDIRCDWAFLFEAIEDLRQFFDQVNNDRYRLYHSTLAEFLTSEKAKTTYGYCYIDAIEQNRKVIQHYRGSDESWQNARLEQFDDYGLRHLAQHLVKATLQRELHQLLNLDKEGFNAWFEAKDSNGDVAGFLEDVALAWSEVEEEFKASPKGELLGLQYRYALMTASIGDRSNNIPSALLAVLVKEGKWLPRRALAYAQQIPDSYQKTRALMELAPNLPEPFKSEAYKAALKSNSYWMQEEVLTNIIQYAPETVLEILPNIESVELQSKIWRNLASCVSDALLEEAFGVIQKAKTSDEVRAVALVALATRMPEFMCQALQALPIIEDNQNKLQSLTRLIPYLQDEHLLEAFRVAQDFLTTDSQIIVLAAFIVRLPNLLDVVIKKIQTETSVEKTDAASITVSSNLPIILPEVISEISEVIWEIQDSASLVKLLISTIYQLPDTLIVAAFTAAQAIGDGEHKLRVISALVPRLTGDLLSEAVQIIIEIGGSSDFENVILNSSYLPNHLLIEMLKAVANYERTRLESKILFSEQSESLRKDIIKRESEKILCLLVAHIPDNLLRETFELVAALEQYQVRRNVLTKLAPRLSNDLRLEAYKAINNIQHKDGLDTKFSKENSLESGVLKAVQTIQDFGDEYDAFHPPIPDSLLEETIELVSTSSEYNLQHKVKVLTTLAPRLPDILLLKAYRVANGTKSQDLQNTLPFEITDSSIQKILKEIRAIHDKDLKMATLKNLIPFLPTSLFPEALKVIKSLRTGFELKTAIHLTSKGQVSIVVRSLFRVFRNLISGEQEEQWLQVLVTVFPYLPHELWEDVLGEVAKIRSDRQRLWMLSSLAPYVPETLLPEVIKLTKGAIHLGSLSSIASYINFVAQLPDTAPEAFEVALGFDEQGDILSGILPLLPASLLPASFKAAKDVLFSNENSLTELKKAISFYSDPK